MYKGFQRALVPVGLLALSGILLGLRTATTPAGRSSSQPAAPSETPRPPAAVPWEPLSQPSYELVEVSQALDERSDRERLEALEALYQDRLRSPVTRGLASYAAGLIEKSSRRSERAIERFRVPELEATELGAYALYHIAGDLKTSRPREALDALDELESLYPDFVLLDEVRLRHARLLSAAGRREEAIRKLHPVTVSRVEKARGEALDELSKLLIEDKRYDEAVAALETLYYELPRHPRAANGGRRLTRLRRRLPDPPASHLYRLALGRAELLMDERRYRDACRELASIARRFAEVADQDLVQLRLGVCQYRRRRLTASLGNFGKVERSELLPEALFYRAEVARRLRRETTYDELASELLERFPDSPWAERMLWSFGNHHESNDEKEVAMGYYRRIADRFPHGERFLDAQWRLLWNDYRQGRYQEAAFGLEEAARKRPGEADVARFLYWAGRAYQEAERFDRAEPLFRQVLLGYQNTYYGRRAFERLSELHGQRASLEAIERARQRIDLGDALAIERVDRQKRIAELFALGRTRAALVEAEKAVQGERDDAAFLAIAAWIHARENRNLDAIVTIRNAFPFHVAATGDLLPRDVWELFYPLPYQEHVERYARERGLDPYLVAGVIRQESTFNPRVRSRAGARGLMQIIPSTGRHLARRERRRYRLRDLYNPEINILYGTRYLKDVIDRFDGRIDYALASYNAGPHRVRRWTNMDLSIDPEVFIEEIPFDETRGYVKLVLRNEMLYRRLYGGGATRAVDD